MNYTLLAGDVLPQLATLAGDSVHCVVTSPPYWGLRDYGVDGQIGLEKTPQEFVARMVEVFREVRRVLKSDGVCFLNMGDSYYGSWGNYGGQNRGKGNSQHGRDAEGRLDADTIRQIGRGLHTAPVFYGLPR
jgi:DNA modification methylase